MRAGPSQLLRPGLEPASEIQPAGGLPALSPDLLDLRGRMREPPGPSWQNLFGLPCDSHLRE